MKIKNTFTFGFLAFCLLGSAAQAQGTVSCEEEIRQTNAFLSSNGQATINNIAALASTLRAIKNYERLPNHYITLEEAKRLGWSGRASDSLWGVTLTHKKMIGGDVYNHSSLSPRVRWLTADIDVSRGLRGSKRLIYNLSNSQRFITTDNYQHLVELENCN